MTDVSIIIVNYNSKDYLFKCVQSIISNVKLNYEIIIVDNNSVDNSIELVKNQLPVDKIIFILLKENIGFAKANNLGVKYAKGNIIHFLNPDTEININQNQSYLQAINDSEVLNSLYVDSIINPKGKLEFHRQNIPLLKNYVNVLLRKKTYIWYTGISLFLHRNVLELIGFWSDDYFMYAEDIDFFYRAQLLNINIKTVDSTIIHYGQICSKSVWDNFNRKKFVEISLKKFCLKYSSIYSYYILKFLMLFYSFFKNPREIILELRVMCFIIFKKV